MSANGWETVVGMEVHVELLTKTKVFCGCSTEFGQEPNTQTCPVCLGLPGSLPVPNKTAFEWSMRVALALNCEIGARTQFERKNYYYPDLPKNYQISQLRKNLGTGGWMEIETSAGRRRIGIDNVHLEEDAGKNIHPEIPGADYSLVDLNRAGTSLLEIVTTPDIRTIEEAQAFMTALKSLLEYLEVSDCNMHEGRLRFEANISVRRKGEPELGNKVEVKNLNSMKVVAKSIEHETERQIEELEAGGRIARETRLWDEDAMETRSMRSKEEAHDYRYFPDPDLIEIVVDEPWIERVRASIPELPEARRGRFVSEFGLPEYDAGVLTADKGIADYFEAALAEHNNPKSVGNWIMTEILKLVKDGETVPADLKATPARLGALIGLIDAGTISGKIAKDVFREICESGGEPGEIVERKGLAQISDSGEIEGIVEKVIAENPASVEDLRGGREKAMGHLVGQVMKASRGKANPKVVNELLRKKVLG